MESLETRVDVSLRKGRVHDFLSGLIELCSKHQASIEIDEDETIVEFNNWDYLTKLEADSEGASLYWPRIQTEIVVRTKNE